MAEGVLRRRAELRAQQEVAKAEAERVRSFKEAAEVARRLAQPPPTPEEELGLTTETEVQAYRRNLGNLKRDLAKFEKANPAGTFDQERAQLFGIGLTDLCCMAFGTERIALWQTKKGTVRAIFEHEDPPDQCNNTIGPAGSRPCWICGMAIDPAQRHPNAQEVADGVKPNPLAPECEHILPIAQAAIFLDLHSRSTGDEERNGIYALEYDWAHSACNQTKNDDVYINNILAAPLGGEFGGFPLIDTRGFAELLRQVRGGKRDRDGAMVRSLNAHVARYGSQQEWIKERTGVLIAKYQAIYRFINARNSAAAPSLFMLSLASCVMQLPNRIRNCEKRDILGLPREGGPGGACAVMGGRRRRRRTRRTRRRYQAIRTSSRRRPVAGMAASF